MPSMDFLVTNNSRNLSIAFWKHHPVEDQSTDGMIAATLAFHQQTQGDMVKLTPAGNYQIAGRGGDAEWLGDELGRRTFVKRAITAPEDWLKLRETVTPQELNIIEAARQLPARLGNDIPLLVTVFSPLTQALMLAGQDTLQAHLQYYPDAVLKGLEILTTTTKRLIVAYEEAGVNGIYYATQHLTDTAIPRHWYQHFGLSIDQEIMQLCHKFKFNILHIHGSGIHFDCLPTASNWMVHFELAENNPTPEEYRASCHCPAVLALPCSLWSHTESLTLEINQLLQRFRQNTALITTQCVVPLDIPNEQIASWIMRVRHAQFSS